METDFEVKRSDVKDTTRTDMVKKHLRNFEGYASKCHGHRQLFQRSHTDLWFAIKDKLVDWLIDWLIVIHWVTDQLVYLFS